MRRVLAILLIYAGLVGIGWYFFSHNVSHIIVGFVFVMIGGVILYYSPYRPSQRRDCFWIDAIQLLEIPIRMMLAIAKFLANLFN